MAKRTDDLEAVRIVTTALGDFGPEEQERIIRWAREKLGLSPAPRNLPEIRVPQPPSPIVPARTPVPTDSTQQSAAAKDLKTFVSAKSPKNDVQFAATVAYFYRFEAPPEQRRNEIDRVVLQDACRLAGRERLNNPLTTLNNAKGLGLLDSGSEAGKFKVNTVGENLVAMTLPSRSDSSATGKKPKKPKKIAKKTAKKKK
jgi:hypothetical protein